MKAMIGLSEIKRIIREELLRNERRQTLNEQRYTPTSDYPIGLNMKDAPGSKIIEKLQDSLGMTPDESDGFFGPDTVAALEPITGHSDVLSAEEAELVKNVAVNLQGLEPGKRDMMDSVVRMAVATVRQGRSKPSDIDVDVTAGAEVDLTPATAGEGSIDGMTPSSWLTAYWSARPGPHARRQALDLRKTTGALEVINYSRKYIDYRQLLDETQSDAHDFTSNPSYSAAPGSGRRPHYHIEAESITAAGEAALAEDPRFGLGGTEYLRSTNRNVTDLNDVGTKMMQLLALSVKDLQEEGKSVAQVVITSSVRLAAHQTRVMIDNWSDSEASSRGSGTAWLISTYRDDRMAKALGKALEGGIVTTSGGGPSSTVAISTIDMQDGRGPLPGDEVEPSIA